MPGYRGGRKQFERQVLAHQLKNLESASSNCKVNKTIVISDDIDSHINENDESNDGSNDEKNDGSNDESNDEKNDGSNDESNDESNDADNFAKIIEVDKEIYKDFNVMTVINSECMIFLEGFEESDDKIPINNYSNITKGQLARRVNSLKQSFRWTESATMEFLNLLKDILPGSKLPVNLTRYGNSYSIIEEYAQKKSSIIEFDCCLKGCCVFVGIRSNLLFCPQCNTKRFERCAKKDYEKCTHKFSLRRAKQKILYRPLLLLIIGLLRTKGFLASLRYKDMDEKKACTMM